MSNIHTSTIALMAALYHESGRQSVATGATLAHAENQAKPFTEFSKLAPDAREGRYMTAEKLLERFDFSMPATPEKFTDAMVNALAVSIHEAERPAIEAGKTVIKLTPPRPFTPFDGLPDPAKQGRRNQARFFLERFKVTPLHPAAGVTPPNPAAPASTPPPAEG
jgi:hypothetical protein